MKPRLRLKAPVRRAASSLAGRDSQTFTLPDGRILGYAEYGCPDGYPLLFMHGFPASRLEAFGGDKAARRLRIRLLSLDRPGFGLATFQPGRRVSDWPADVRAFADHLRIPRFAVLGGSGGSPYALACAHALPRERVSSVGIMAGMGSFDPGTPGIPFSRRALAASVKYAPSVVGLLTGASIGGARWALTTRTGTRWIDRWIEAMRASEAEAAARQGSPELEGEAALEEGTTAEKRERLLRIAFDGFSQGAKAAVQDARVVSSDWGFRLEDVAYDPILIWHGTKDANAPIEWARSMAGRLPHSELKEFEGETHYTMHRYLEEILSALVPGH